MDDQELEVQDQGEETADNQDAGPAADAEWPIVGDMVHYVLPDGPNQGNHRPGIVVEVWSADCVSIQVFTDGSNDGDHYRGGIARKTSVLYDEDGAPDSWHWIERA